MSSTEVDGGGDGRHDDNSSSKKRSRGGDNNIDDDHALHLWTEKERRKKMKDMFSSLHHLLPHIPLKADKSTIVDEAVTYIQNLQVILEEFQRLKLERIQNIGGQNLINTTTYNPHDHVVLQQTTTSNSIITPLPPPPVFETWTWPNVVLNVCGEQGQFSVCALKKPNISSSICFFFEKHNLDVLYCNLISNQTWCIYIIQAQVRKESSTHHHLGYNDHQLMSTTDDAFPAPVEIFKRAATDITYWVSNSTT